MYEREDWNVRDEEEDLEIIDAFCDFIRRCEDGRVRILDFSVYKRMMELESRLRNMLPTIGEGGKVWSEILEVFACGIVTVEIDEIRFSKSLILSGLLKLADDFEVYPTSDGKIRVLFGFKGVLKSI